MRGKTLVVDTFSYGVSWYTTRLTFSSDSKLIMSITDRVGLWDVETRQLLYILYIDAGLIGDVRFSDTGEYIDTEMGRIGTGTLASAKDKCLVGWSLRNGWFEWKGRRVFPAPPERVQHSRLRRYVIGNLFIMILRGRVSMLELNSNGPISLYEQAPCPDFAKPNAPLTQSQKIPRYSKLSPELPDSVHNLIGSIPGSREGIMW